VAYQRNVIEKADASQTGGAPERRCELVSTNYELSLVEWISDIENSGLETGRQNSAMGPPSKSISSAGDRHSHANALKCRRFFSHLDVPYRDGTGWLGRQDSNLGMAESKSAALPLGYAPIRRRMAPGTGQRAPDHSEATAANQCPRPRRLHPTPALRHIIMSETVMAWPVPAGIFTSRATYVRSCRCRG
jgi:hypothetical protein